MSLSALLASSDPLTDGFGLAIPENWHQGRTAYGGLSAALALVAARQVGGEDLPPLRSAQVSFVGPLYGAVNVQAKVVRRGRNVTWIESQVLREGEVGLVAMFVFMQPVASKLKLPAQFALPDYLPVDSAEIRQPPQQIRLFDNLEVRFAVPRDREKRPEICWWVRAVDREGLDSVLQLMLCADAPPPGVFPLLDRPIPPISSMTWLANFLDPAPQTIDGWWLMRVSGDYASQGCSSDRTEIWNADGEPVLLGMQAVAIFG